MKQVEATILGQSYALTCPPDGEALLREAVAIVDREMSAIRDAGKVKARERMAVLAALNLAYQRAEQAARSARALEALNAQAVGHSAAQAAGHTAAHASALRPRGTTDHAGDPDIDRLIARIDAALGDDGHLL